MTQKRKKTRARRKKFIQKILSIGVELFGGFGLFAFQPALLVLLLARVAAFFRVIFLHARVHLLVQTLHAGRPTRSLRRRVLFGNHVGHVALFAGRCGRLVHFLDFGGLLARADLGVLEEGCRLLLGLVQALGHAPLLARLRLNHFLDCLHVELLLTASKKVTVEK